MVPESPFRFLNEYPIVALRAGTGHVGSRLVMTLTVVLVVVQEPSARITVTHDNQWIPMLEIFGKVRS